jgi:hypothetical protein
MDEMESHTVPVLALVRDLMFSSKITATAKAVGAEVMVIRDPIQLAGHEGRILLVDLNLTGAIDAAAKWRQTSGGATVLGFVSHVDTETIQRARDAGLDQVMARSGFVASLAGLLSSQT